MGDGIWYTANVIGFDKFDRRCYTQFGSAYRVHPAKVRSFWWGGQAKAR